MYGKGMVNLSQVLCISCQVPLSGHLGTSQKLTNKYKAWEFLLYLYGLGPWLLYGILPNVYYSNYCKLVYGIQLMDQHNISQDNIYNTYLALASFTQEFEEIYC